jgi:hypothetical protein
MLNKFRGEKRGNPGPSGPVLGSFPLPHGALGIPAGQETIGTARMIHLRGRVFDSPRAHFLFTILPQDTNRPNIFKFLLLLLSPACRGIADGSNSLACRPRSTRPA